MEGRKKRTRRKKDGSRAGKDKQTKCRRDVKNRQRKTEKLRAGGG